MILARIGVYGLGTMGSALALNMAEHGVTVAVTSRGADRVREFVAGAGDLATRLVPHERLKDFVSGLARPRLMLFMIPSGAPLDAMIEKVVPLLEPGDTIIDGGNADFHRTRRRAAALAQEGLHFVGMGVSGGAEGARHGPSMMVGGSEESWQRLRPILELIAARYKGDPCVARVGPDGAGHFVKMVHNGIEYADMQMIAEIYGLLRFGAAWTPEAIGRLFAGWNRGALRSYLLEITADILQCFDPETGHPMVDVIRDSAGQKGTGRWTVIEAVRLGQSASMIEAALGARAWSGDLLDASGMRADQMPALAEGASSGPCAGLPGDGGRVARVRLVARSCAYRGDLARGLHHPLGDARRYRRGVSGRAAARRADPLAAPCGASRRRPCGAPRGGGLGRPGRPRGAGALGGAAMDRYHAAGFRHRRHHSGAARLLRPSRLRAVRPGGSLSRPLVAGLSRGRPSGQPPLTISSRPAPPSIQPCSASRKAETSRRGRPAARPDISCSRGSPGSSGTAASRSPP